MIKLGHIEIKDNKVIFVYYLMEKPNPDDYFAGTHLFRKRSLEGDTEEYQASKREVEVNNVTIIYEWPDKIENPNDDKIYGYCIDLPKPDEKGNTAKMIKHNQPCKATIENNKATILKIL